MSATSDHLIETVEGIMSARGIPASDTGAFDEIQESVMAGTGYVCKRCNGPAPMGVGYAFQSLPGVVASLSIDACPCGQSRLAPGAGIRVAIVDGSIPLPIVELCGDCKGLGEVWGEKCWKCEGTGDAA